MKVSLATLLAAAGCGLLPGPAASQSFHIGNARAFPGNVATVQVSYIANPAIPVADYELHVSYDRVRFLAPACTPAPGVRCLVTDVGKIKIFPVTTNLSPSGEPTTQPAALLHFPVKSNALPGIYGIGANFFEFASIWHPDPVEGTVHTGAIAVLGDEAPRGEPLWPFH